ncbi:putative translin isoform X1 [Apostichopus japonicus]|uniref:Translin n=1 Tax=Stichopus japonicus TaxID=307972 RepID=A0A2G8KMQ7_STIJA|nr:putative translin isoform X1 [Apostichopus japonicus]
MADTSEVISKIFNEFNTFLVNDQDTREKIRDAVRTLEQTAREIMTTLQAIHQKSGLSDVLSVCKKARDMFVSIQAQFKALQETFPAEQYYRYSDHWKFGIQRLAFLASLIIYLEGEKLASREEVAQLLGVAVKKEDGFHIDLEDFLHGLLTLANELSRLAVNSVTLVLLTTAQDSCVPERSRLRLPSPKPQERQSPEKIRRFEV